MTMLHSNVLCPEIMAIARNTNQCNCNW